MNDSLIARTKFTRDQRLKKETLLPLQDTYLPEGGVSRGKCKSNLNRAKTQIASPSAGRRVDAPVPRDNAISTATAPPCTSRVVASVPERKPG
jgi:hypothetical protein